jgi:hypothetical protein
MTRLEDATRRRQELWCCAAQRRAPASPVGLTDGERLELEQLSALIGALYDHRRRTRKHSRDLEITRADDHRRHTNKSKLRMATSDVEFVLRARWGPAKGQWEGEPYQERLDINHGKNRRPVKTLAQLEVDRKSGDHEEDGADLGTTPQAFYNSPQSEYRIPLGDEGAQKVDFLASGGWHIEHAGATGGKRGRPVKGATSRELIRQRFEALLDRPLDDVLAEAKLSAGGRKNPASRAAHDELARPVHLLVRARQRPVNRAALASVLGCSSRTVDRLAESGQTQLTQNPSKRGEERTPMIPTDDQLAIEAERLAEVAEELFGMAIRFQARFPASSVLAQTADRFIQAALDGDALERTA